jgi:hypothetical protein
MDASAYIGFIDQLTANLASRHDVLGLVLVGSTADRARQDEWSDHDFFVITEDASAEPMRANLDWLPDHDTIALAPRETAHGLKVIYESGHVLEFAVFTLGELSLAGANAFEVALDRGGIAPIMESLAKRPRAPRDDEADLALMLSHILIGVGRARRGELLVAGNLIRSYAVERLLTVLAHRSPDPRLDNLDSFRRVELVFPWLKLDEALAQSPEAAARAVLAIAERELGPITGAVVLRTRLGWSD